MREYTFSCFSTKCVIKLEASEIIASSLANQCFERCKNLHLKYNYFDNNSLVSKINQRIKNRIKLDIESANILTKVFELCKITDFNFDICLINKKLNNGAKYGKDAYVIEKRYIEFSDIKTQIDLGGVIKEYAVDCCAKICEKYPYVINFGGDLRTNKDIFVNLKDPKNPQNALVRIKLEQKALTSSAQYERINHIVNTSDFAYAQVSVIGDDALSCGVFSTSLGFSDYVLPKGYYAIMIDFDNNIFYKNKENCSLTN